MRQRISIFLFVVIIIIGCKHLRLVTSTCAGYDDDVQICCEHGGEGGQNVSLTAGVHEQQVTGGGGWLQPSELFILLLSTLLLLFISHLQLVLILVRGSLMKAGGGWREPPAVACSSRNAA